MKPDEALARLAARQYGLFTKEQALDRGLTPKMLHGRLNRGHIEVIEPRVYRFMATPQTWHQRVLAACLAEDGVASHRTAAALWGLDGCRPGIVEVTTRRWKRRPNGSVRIHETRVLEEADRAEVMGIPVTSRERTVVDLRQVLPRRRVEDAMDTHGVVLEGVWDCTERLENPGRPWVGDVRRMVAPRLGRECVPPNRFEKKLYGLLRRAGLPLPEPQVEILRADGSLLGRVDWCFVQWKLVLECDSYEHHGQWVRRKRDLRRDRELTALGYRVMRVSWEDVSEPDLQQQLLLDVDGAVQLLSA